MAPGDYDVVVNIIDSRGLQEFGSYDVNLFLTVYGNPNGPSLPNPTPRPTIGYLQYHYAGCCTPEVLYVNEPFGGTWAVSGSVTWQGRTAYVAGSGTVPPPS